MTEERCNCGRPAAVLMSLETPSGWAVGEWWLCEEHASHALGGAGIDTTAEVIDFSDDPADEDEPNLEE